MVSAIVDPSHPERVAVTVTITMYLDKLMTEALSTEVSDAVRRKCVEDIHTNEEVKQAIAKAATAKLLSMLEAKQ